MLTLREGNECLKSHADRMNRRHYLEFDIPSSSYTKALSAYFASVQLIVRSGQLDTMMRRWGRGMKDNCKGRCEFGCNNWQNKHHLFVECSKFKGMRTEVTERILKTTLAEIEKGMPPQKEVMEIVEIARIITQDDNRWHLGRSKYYLGWIPSIEERSDQISHLRRNTRKNLALIWHNELIRLTGRI